MTCIVSKVIHSEVLAMPFGFFLIFNILLTWQHVDVDEYLYDYLKIYQ